jgi:hypothetical protein
MVFAMTRKVVFASVASLLLGAAALFACVGDAAVTPPVDAGGNETSTADTGSDAAAPLLSCPSGETLETFDEPMNVSSNFDLCSVTGGACDQAVTNGVTYSGGTFKAAIDYSGSALAFSARAHEALGKPNVAEAIVTYELTIDAITKADAGWQSVGCLIDLSEVNDAGALTFISRTELATNGAGGSAFAYVNGNRAGGTSLPMPGFSTEPTTPMTITIRLDRRSATKATFTLASNSGTSTVNLNPTGASRLGLACGVGREGAGTSKISVRKLRYARCLKP